MNRVQAPAAVKVDFNEVFEDNQVWASLRWSPSLAASQLAEGDLVELYDEDGETCLAVVMSRTGPIITCRISWPTWRSVRASLIASSMALVGAQLDRGSGKLSTTPAPANQPTLLPV